ncbi:glutaminyl-peptide cyclotransferase-like [Drosophila innubila]|uniref:glutaminyl-peptide cyclotransferase-like n=1 Tax=Drosophila innubila TaxID=198719 RepID=UPI00148E2DCB|nr:glutaminyl-peptide cyclotransferase-like [Drosophila innubila]
MCLFLVLVIISLLTWIRVNPTLSISSDEKNFINALNNILIPRSLDSKGHAKVCDFLEEELEKLGFKAILDESDEPYPLANVIGITNPSAKRFLLLSCHYDSKYLESTNIFVSATDAGVSCAILLNMAKTLTSLPDLDLFQRDDIGLVLAFFDAHDSTNGMNDGFIPLYGSRNFIQNEIISLKRINAVITLNLIGAPNQIYMSKYEKTFIFHEHMADVEIKLKESGQLHKCHQLFYKLKDHDSDFDDDHYSFLEAGVPVMHVVPHTYPEVWHQEEDNFENLHWPSVHNMNAIMTRFVYDYFRYYFEYTDDSD